MDWHLLGRSKFIHSLVKNFASLAGKISIAANKTIGFRLRPIGSGVIGTSSECRFWQPSGRIDERTRSAGGNPTTGTRTTATAAETTATATAETAAAKTTTTRATTARATSAAATATTATSASSPATSAASTAHASRSVEVDRTFNSSNGRDLVLNVSITPDNCNCVAG